MNTKEFKNGVISATLGSLWWGVIGTYFFQLISFVGTLDIFVSAHQQRTAQAELPYKLAFVLVVGVPACACGVFCGF